MRLCCLRRGGPRSMSVLCLDSTANDEAGAAVVAYLRPEHRKGERPSHSF
jgi:hypothetical protein